MPGKVLLSTAYLPPAEYFAKIAAASEVFVEKEENYHKQTYRNRCYILTASGPQSLTIPVYLGSFHKTPVKDIRIDYSKRWQKVHLGAIAAAYGSSPYVIYYFDIIEKAIMKNHEFLLDLNMELLASLADMIRLDCRFSFTTEFEPAGRKDNDFRYLITPKNRSDYRTKTYAGVFTAEKIHPWRISIIDLIFNCGPETMNYL
ncbi:MAG: WbqC family protein [Bacteroidales bacterium]|jgi:hypothetical protein|nr:WbqC family protein [Bacteroidales bacterium]